MQLSNRIQSVVDGSSDGWSLYYRARSMRAAGTPVTMLSIGDHDIKTDASILGAMKSSMDRGNLGYASVMGSDALRDAIARRVTSRTETPAARGNIIVTPGGQAALFASMMAVVDPGQSCVVLDPFYATFPQTVRAAGGRAIQVQTPADQGFQPDISMIEAALQDDTVAILINSPNNPTGVVYSPERLQALGALCQRRKLWLISDELYGCQIHDGVHVSARDLPGMADQCLVVGSLSKSHAMTGSRVGWVVGPEQAIDRLGELANTTTYGIPGFIQDAGHFALTEGEAIEDQIGARYSRRARAALEAIGNAPGVRPVSPQGGMYLMLDIRETGLSGNEFGDRLLDAEHIAVMPGESFGKAAAGHLRIALTVPEEQLRDALGRIARFASGLV